MHVLIVHAHPEPKSFTAAMKDVAVQAGASTTAAGSPESGRQSRSP
jgi:putative NADPH-quinone reductase